MGKKIEKTDVAPLKAAAKKAVKPAKAAEKIVSPSSVVTADTTKKPAQKASSVQPVRPKKAAQDLGKSPSGKREYSHEEIQIQAYFVAERRQAMGLPGDEASDWAEAERQLRASE